MTKSEKENKKKTGSNFSAEAEAEAKKISIQIHNSKRCQVQASSFAYPAWAKVPKKRYNEFKS